MISIFKITFADGREHIGQTTLALNEEVERLKGNRKNPILAAALAAGGYSCRVLTHKHGRVTADQTVGQRRGELKNPLEPCAAAGAMRAAPPPAAPPAAAQEQVNSDAPTAPPQKKGDSDAPTAPPQVGIFPPAQIQCGAGARRQNAKTPPLMTVGPPPPRQYHPYTPRKRGGKWRSPAPGVLRCPRCDTAKPAGAFTKDKSSRGGYTSRCKECAASGARACYLKKIGGEYKQNAPRVNGVRTYNKAVVTQKQDGICRVCQTKIPPNTRRQRECCGEECAASWRKQWEAQSLRAHRAAAPADLCVICSRQILAWPKCGRRAEVCSTACHKIRRDRRNAKWQKERYIRVADREHGAVRTEKYKR